MTLSQAADEAEPWSSSVVAGSIVDRSVVVMSTSVARDSRPFRHRPDATAMRQDQ
jgi:hypothetical protein